MSVEVQAQPNKAENNKSEKTRRLILSNATRIFLERGFRSVSVDELCKIIGVSRGTFYKYFPNRDALVETLFDECICELLPAIEENFQSGKDVEQIIEIHYTVMLDFFSSRISVPMLADMEIQMPRIWKRIDQVRKYEEKEREKLIKRGQKEGSVRKDIDPVTMSMLINEMILSVSRPGFLLSQGLTLKQVSSMIKAILLNGIIEPSRK